MTSTPEDNIRITLPESLRRLVRLLLIIGIRFEAYAGISVKRFLEENLPAGKDYIEKSIQTVFIDGQAIDEPEKSYIQEPCTIALSAAMPGVFGAAFRKKGLYGGLRSGYNKYPEKQETLCNTGKTVPVTLKCFNQVARDLGDELLNREIRMNIKDFLKFWNQHKGVLEKTCLQVLINGRNVDPLLIPEMLKRNGSLKIEFRYSNFV